MLVVVILGIGTVVTTLELFARLVPTESLPGSLSMIAQAMQLRTHAFYVRDPHFRYITGPNLNFQIEHRDFTYRVITKVNFEQAGFRGGTLGGPAWGIALGDSTTFGMGLDHQATWVAQLTGLAQREIINLGVPGWGPQQYTRALERYGIPLKPKIVLYAISHNDPQDALLFERWLNDHTLSYRLTNLLRQHSITYNLLRLTARLGWQTRQNVIHLDELEAAFSSKSLSRGLEEDRRIFNAAWPLVEREIKQAIEHSQRNNATFLLLYVPSKEEAYWELMKRKSPSLEPLGDAVEIIRRNMLRFCALRHVACVDPTPRLRRNASQGQKLYFSTDAHATENGNRLIAQEVYQFLRTTSLLP